MKHTARHNIWSKVDRIQTAPDMRKTIRNPHDKDDRELKNSFRL